MRRVPCIDKLYGLTNFRPQTSLGEIIDRVAAYFRQRDGFWQFPRLLLPRAPLPERYLTVF